MCAKVRVFRQPLGNANLRWSSGGTHRDRNEYTLYYTCVASITTKNGQMPELLRKAELELLPLYRDLPGFAGFSVTKTSDVSAIALSLWQTRDQAKYSIVASEQVISVGFASLIERIENHVGVTPFFVFTGEVVASASAAPVAGRKI